MDQLGIIETRTIETRSKKEKGRVKHTRRKTRPTTFVFVPSSKKTQLYRDYFTPDFAVECRMIGLRMEVRLNDITRYIP
jgi:meiosis-specific protein HOP1